MLRHIGSTTSSVYIAPHAQIPHVYHACHWPKYHLQMYARIHIAHLPFLAQMRTDKIFAPVNHKSCICARLRPIFRWWWLEISPIYFYFASWRGKFIFRSAPKIYNTRAHIDSETRLHVVVAGRGADRILLRARRVVSSFSKLDNNINYYVFTLGAFLVLRLAFLCDVLLSRFSTYFHHFRCVILFSRNTHTHIDRCSHTNTHTNTYSYGNNGTH